MVFAGEKARRLRDSELLLPTRSRASQRIWRTRAGGPPHIEHQLRACPHDKRSFASLRSILRQLRSEYPSSARYSHQLDTIDSYLVDVCPDSSDPTLDSHGNLLADAVAFAVLRRISRESVYTSRVIDLSARTINSILSETPHCNKVIEHLDRPTLKVLARAMLLLEAEHHFSWVWHISSDAFDLSGANENLYLRSRRRLLRYLLHVLSPRIETDSGTCLPAFQSKTTEKVALVEISAALVLQNYDACFLWCDERLTSCSPEDSADVLRFKSLAAINVGEVDSSLMMLREAERQAMRPAQVAHLSYLQGLIEAKRCYRLQCSDDHYLRGLSLIDHANRTFDDDLDLERAWLLNGLALNAALRWKRRPKQTVLFRTAFANVRQAFSLVRDGDSAARVYLRANLLANFAFLLEMQGSYDLALRAIEKGFDYAGASEGMRERFQTTLGYRIGMLHFRAGRPDRARLLLEEALKSDSGTEHWATQDRILRALGAVALSQSLLTDAAEWHRWGYELCRSARAAEGTREHAKALVQILIKTGHRKDALELCENLAEEEGLQLLSCESSSGLEEIVPSRLSPKLPAYIPAIDLEDIPEIDLNRFLSGSERNTPSQLT